MLRSRLCIQCGTRSTRVAMFCGACGQALPGGGDSASAPHLAIEPKRAVVAIAIVFVGALLAVAACGWLALATGAETASGLALVVLLAGLAFAAARVLGERGLRSSLPLVCLQRHAALGLLVGVVTFGASLGYVVLLQRFVGTTRESSEPSAWTELVVQLLLAALIVPLIEEWACRGVLWSACRSVESVGTTICATAALFALLHGLNGAALLETPHRFLSGLAYGWLRARSESLTPGMLAHGLHNLLAVGFAAAG